MILMIKLKVEKVLFENDNTVIFKPELVKNGYLKTYFFNVKFKNIKDTVRVGDVFELESENIVDNGSYGSLLIVNKDTDVKKVETFNVSYVKFLLENVEGIGKKTAEKLVDEFGESLISVIEKDY
jgi:5'-3' exonuclease